MEELSYVKLNFSSSSYTFDQNTKKDILDNIEKEIQKIEKDVIILIDEIKTQKTFCQNIGKKLLIITLFS
ncbi:hypothetical protein ACN5PC_10970, partial [Aliarcobacter butzleri]|uniref:hypothetical protein n=1 Tax=Aliarcobacter butzleri TaxID=28197 RepID=UPI003AF6618A